MAIVKAKVDQIMCDLWADSAQNRQVKTTRKTGGLHKPYKGLRQTAPKGAVKRSADRI